MAHPVGVPSSFGIAFVFGHWSALGFYTSQNCYAIDTGCVWGRELTALRLDFDGVKRFSVTSQNRKF